MKHEECMIQLIGLATVLRLRPDTLDALCKDAATGRVTICAECRGSIVCVFEAMRQPVHA